MEDSSDNDELSTDVTGLLKTGFFQISQSGETPRERRRNCENKIRLDAIYAGLWKTLLFSKLKIENL